MLWSWLPSCFCEALSEILNSQPIPSSLFHLLDFHLRILLRINRFKIERQKRLDYLYRDAIYSESIRCLPTEKGLSFHSSLPLFQHWIFSQRYKVSVLKCKRSSQTLLALITSETIERGAKHPSASCHHEVQQLPVLSDQFFGANCNLLDNISNNPVA